MKIKITLFLILIASSYLFGQNTLSYTDSTALNFKGSSVEEIHDLLVKELNSETEKVRAFYIWTTGNIKYDVSEWQRPTSDIAKQQPAHVIKTKLAVCHGYSELFKAFCDLSKIKCYLVSGYVKREDKFINEGHTWNVVSLNNKWYQVDATWGAGGIGTNGKFIKDFQNSYYLPDPVEFLESHYPFDPAWQLVNYPISINEFKVKGWKYLENNKNKVYNYNDTISKWESEDVADRRVISGERMVAINPDDIESRKELGYALMDKAYNQMKEGNDILNKLYGTGNNNTNSTSKSSPVRDDAYKSHLNSARNLLQSSDNLLVRAQDYNKLEKANIQKARAAISHNLKVIESELSR